MFTNQTFGALGASTEAFMPKFIAILDANKDHQGGDQTEVGWRVNGMYELKHTNHGLSDYYTDFWWESLPWKNSSSYVTRLVRKKSDNTWLIITSSNSLQYYSNPATTSIPPTSGWVNSTHGASPVPKITFNAVITEQDLTSTSNCVELSRTTNSVTLKSTSSSAAKNITFGANTLSVGQKYVVGFKLESSGNSNGSVANLFFGGVTYIQTSAPFDTVDEGDFRLHSFDQTVGKSREGNDVTPNSNGLLIQTYGTFFPTDATTTIKDLRIFAL